MLAIVKGGKVIKDRSPGGDLATLMRPLERAGVLMVFRTFQHLSYALVLEVTQPIAVGDRVVNPR